MNPTDQLAAEAWTKIQEDVDDHLLDSEIGIAIIKSAIEKATEPLNEQIMFLQKVVNQRTEALQRAAHASEPWTKLPEIIGSCNCLTKTPDHKYHLVTCRYRQIMESQAHNATLQTCDQCSRKLEDGSLYNDHSLQPQSDDTKRREWIEQVRPTITFNDTGCEVYGLAGNFCIGEGKTFIEAINAAMSQTKERK